jgi:membrane-associated phospholipid phosphatase
MSLLTDVRARPQLALGVIGGLAGFVVVALLVRAGVTESIDTAGLQALATLHGSVLDPIMVGISELGVADILGFFSMFPAGFLWAMGNRRAAVFVGVGYLAAAIASDAVKAAVVRPRPPAIYQIPLKMPETEDLIWAGLAVVLVIALWRTRWRWGAVIGAVLFAITIWYDPTPLSTAGLDSFPSGHAFRSIVLIGSLLIAVPWRPSRRVVAALAAILLAIGVSRVYLGEHHPSDVIAGWFGGLALVCTLALLPIFRVRDAAAPAESLRQEAAGRELESPGRDVATGRM